MADIASLRAMADSIQTALNALMLEIELFEIEQVAAAANLKPAAVQPAKVVDLTPFKPAKTLADLRSTLATSADVIDLPGARAMTGREQPAPKSVNVSPDMRDTPNKPDELVISPEWQNVINEILHGTENIFITGKAGTGKTTLLHHVVKEFWGNSAIVAFTGVAALRAGGQTIHSFFHFGAHALQRDDIRELSDDRKWKYKALDLLFIDEVSMVRADIMDAIDIFLRKNGKHTDLPFGGCRIIMIGDPYQLPPVSREKEERQWLFERYGTEDPYFFHAEVWRERPIKVFELTQIFRQKDPRFTDALNAIRAGRASQNDLNLLNSRTRRDFKPPVGELWITLTTTNDNADKANARMMADLPGEAKVYEAIVTDDFDRKNCPTDEQLSLKVGAAVMFVKNNHMYGWANGTMGTVVSLDPVIKVQVDSEELGTQEFPVEKETWEQYVYEYDTETKKLTKQVKGKFSQIPLRLAAAITIHKCLAGDTEIATANRGLVQIANIIPGDLVYTDDGSPQKVTLASYIGLRSTLTIRTAGGREIKCTHEHKLCIKENDESQWYEAQQLCAGDLLVVPSFLAREAFITKLPAPQYGLRSKPICLPSIMTSDLSWWLGVLVGDGSYSDTSEGDFWLTVSSPEVRDRFIAITQSFGINVGQRQKPNNASFDLWFNSVPLRLWLDGLGLHYHTASSKTVPDIILECNAAIRAAFIQGLFDTDGSVNGAGHIIFTTTSKCLVTQLHLLLDGLGIEARKARPQPSVIHQNGEKRPTGKTSYQLRIVGHAEPKFINLVGFTRPDRLNRWINKGWSEEKCTHSSLIPHTDSIVEIIENDDLEDVYDLEVQTNHNFYANGLLVSNSQGLSLDRVIVDLYNGAFAAGQTYVALSRARSLAGLVLRKSVNVRDLITSIEVVNFMTGKPIARPKPRSGQLSLLDEPTTPDAQNKPSAA